MRQCVLSVLRPHSLRLRLHCPALPELFARHDDSTHGDTAARRSVGHLDASTRTSTSTRADSEAGLLLVASVDSGEVDAELNEVKNKCKLVQRRLDRNSEPQASIESGNYTYQCARCPFPGLPRTLPRLTRTQQLPHRRRTLLPLHLRPLLPTQARLHLPFRPLQRVQQHVRPRKVLCTRVAALCFLRIRRLHTKDKGDIPRLARDAESRQAE